MKEIRKVKEAVNTYSHVIQTLTGNKFLKAKEPSPFGGQWNACVAVYDGCKALGVSLTEYFALANLKFDLAWTEATFKRPYLPLSVASSIRVRDWVFKSWGGNVKKSFANNTIREDFLRSILNRYPASVVDTLVGEIEGER